MREAQARSKYALHDTSNFRGASFWIIDSSYAQQISGAGGTIQWKYQAISTILIFHSASTARNGINTISLILPVTNGTSE